MQEKYNLPKAQEQTRAQIALLLIYTLMGIIAFLMIVATVMGTDCYLSKTCANAKDTLAVFSAVMNITFTPIVGLVASVIGFYFGSKATERNDGG